MFVLNLFKVRKEVKAGILVTVAIILFVFGFNFLKGRSIFKNERVFYAVYDNIDGLTRSNPVTVNGMTVGHVSETEIVPGKTGKIAVSFIVHNEKVEIPIHSSARIASMDLLGSKSIDIILSNENQYYRTGDTLVAEVQASLTEEVNRQVAPLKLKAESLIGSVDSVMTIVQTVLNKETISNLEKSFRSLNKTINSLENTAYRIDTVIGEERGRINIIMRNIESISTNFRENNQQLTNVLQNMESITDSLARADIASAINNAERSLLQANRIFEKINKGEGSMGMLLNDEKLYQNLEKSASELEKLLKDMRLNPQRYLHFSILGRRDKSTQTDTSK